MTSKRARKVIRDLVRAGRWILTEHAVERLIERDVLVEDVQHALSNCVSCRAQARGRWLVSGPDRMGDAVRLIIEVDAQLVVVTMFRGDEQ